MRHFLCARAFQSLTDPPMNSVPVSLFAQWPSSYVNTFFSLYFTVRARFVVSFRDARRSAS